MQLLSLNSVTNEFIEARPYYEIMNPSWSSLAIPKWLGYVTTGKMVYSVLKKIRKGDDFAEALGATLGTVFMKKVILKVPRAQIKQSYVHVQNAPSKDFFRKNGLGGRGWIYSPGRYKMTIVYHDANRVGPHVDVHLGRLSMVYRVKPDVHDRLRYNSKGYLTESSQTILIDFIKSEIAKGARVPQNLDHSMANAKSSWTHGDPNAKEYGAGVSRQVIGSFDVDVYKTALGHPIEFFAPKLNPHRAMYIFKLHPGNEKLTPILIWGNRKASPPKLQDRLHLKLIQPNETDKIEGKYDPKTTTAKYDGSSCYIVIGKSGTTIWSPRTSVRTGEAIEYTHRIGGLSQLRSDETIVGMGELLYREKSLLGKRSYLPQAASGGLLTAHELLPKHLVPEIRLYRIDRIGRKTTTHLNFHENRILQQQVSKMHPHLEVVETMSPSQAQDKGFEGYVTVPHDSSINEGFKIKWWQDPHDWRIDEVAFTPGDKGGIAGVTWATSLESGKRFKLGPGQVGAHDLVREMMENPEEYIGKVIKVQSRHGHEGRASVVLEFHTDKGT